MKKNLFLWLLFILAISATACKDDSDDEYGPPLAPTGHWPVRLSFRIDNQPLLFDSVIYTNAAGNSYSVHQLQFYLSGFEFTDVSGAKFSSDTVIYADARDLQTLTFELHDIPEGSYTAVSFRVGMDSANNVSNCLPANMVNMNMAWPEQMGGGYHFLKLEGIFEEGPGVYGYAMHLGTNPCCVPVLLTGGMNHGSGTDTLKLTMNINEWFVNPNVFDFSSGYNYTMGNDTAMLQLAANGSDVFY